ncbi:MAG: hypothetical protein WBC91_15845 [Phototrophicaceae bacterium]
MTVKLAWYYPDQVAIMQLIGETSATEFMQASEILYDWYDNSPTERIHLIVDDTYLTKLPNLAGLTKVKIHPKRGTIIIVAIPNKLMEFLANVAVQISKAKVLFVDTLPEADVTMKKIAQGLVQLPAPTDIVWLEEITDNNFETLSSDH